MTLSRSIPALSVLFAIVAATPAQAASPLLPAGQRSHSRVATFDRGDLRVRRLQMAVTRSDGVLHAHVALTVRNESDHVVTRRLNVGRCTRGNLAYPVCPTAARVRVRVAPGQLRSYSERMTLRQPPRRTDSIQAAVVKATTGQPYYADRTDAVLLLRGAAWRGTSAGRTYGATFGPGDGARRLNFDIPATSADSAYIDVVWQGTAAPTAATTTISRCKGAECTAEKLAADRSRSKPMAFGNRFDFENAGADSIGLRATNPDGTELFSAALPWPA